MFSSSTPSMIKCATGINIYGDRIKKIDKSNTKAFFPLCGADEDWEPVMLCEKNRENKEEWAKKLEKKLKR